MSEKKWDPVTVAISAFAVVALIVWDVWTLMKRGYHTTISSNLQYFARMYPIIAFAVGVVVGHLWWPHGDCVK